MHNKFILLIFLVLQSILSTSQSHQIDSLTALISTGTNEISVYNDLSELLILSNPLLANNYALTALKLSNEANDQISKSKSLRLLFEYNIQTKNIEKIRHYEEETDKLSHQNNSNYIDGTSEYCKGLLKFETTDLVNSSKHFFKALHSFEKTKSIIEICKTYKYIGRIFYNQKAYDKALEYYFLALNVAKANNYQQGIAAGLNNVAAVMDTKEQYHKAIQYFEQALLINIATNNIKWQSINHLNIGIENQKLKKYSEAKLSFKKALELATASESKRIISDTNNSISSLFIDLQQIDSAYFYSKLAYDVAYRGKIIKGIVQSTSTLHDIALLQKDTISAYRYEIQNRTYVDSFYRAEHLQQTHLMEYEYELSKRREQTKHYRLKNRLTFIIIGLTTFILLVIGIILHNRLKEKVKKSENRKVLMEQEIKRKNRELTTKALYMIQKNETMSQISTQLSKLESNLKIESNKKIIQQIAARLKRNTDEEVWQEFELYFQSVHPTFYKNLQKKVPDLTISEKKLAAFLRMNMTSKEISTITNQRISTLEVARSRLRKKLNITNKSISLPTFLSQF